MRLSLADAFKYCEQMWKWIDEQVANGYKGAIGYLKRKWLAEHGFERGEIEAACFFCGYNNQQSDWLNCVQCPGVLVDSNFTCGNNVYSWWMKPREFYQKVVELHKQWLVLQENKDDSLPTRQN